MWNKFNKIHFYAKNNEKSDFVKVGIFVVKGVISW
jgi:hypothetical protein